MLHAIYHNKGQLWKRYIGQRDGLEGNVHAEDEITSAFLGTQEFLDPEHVWRLWQAIVGEKIIPPNAEHSPVSFAIKLWPRRGIEPDAMITFVWSNCAERHLMIEFKWDAGESGDGQLEKQWKEFLSDNERENALHLFIAKDIGPALPYLNQWRMCPITWLHVRSALMSIPRDGKLATYCDLMDRFLEKIQIYPFNGFCRLPEAPDLPPNRFGDPIFFTQPRNFGGFSRLPDSPDFPHSECEQVFFSIS